MVVDKISTVEQLEELLSEPTPQVVATLGKLEGDILLLGVAGKIGPSLARMVKRASDAAGIRRRVIGVSRFGGNGLEARLRQQGIETIRCDLLESAQLQQLPQAANVIYLAGMKFGTSGQESKTWTINSFLPGLVGRQFPHSRLIVYSTGNIYGLTPVAGGGSRESDAANPVGEYAMSCLGRERIFEYFSRRLGIPMTIIRLNYACDLRYGVLVDLAVRVWTGQPIDLSMGYLNTIWQGDANAWTLLSFDQAASPPSILNLTGAELLSVRAQAESFGRLMHKEVTFIGVEADQALLSNATQAHHLFGRPRIGTGQMLEWIADWVTRGNPLLGKPTHYETADGRF